MINLSSLINRCKKGDRKAQEQLYDLFGSAWFMICLRYLGNRADALDTLQNALIKIYLKLDQYKEELASFSTWSNKVVVNESLMFLRKRKSKYEELEINDETLKVHFRDETPIESLSSQELMKLVQNLPEGYRMVFNMYVIEGYSHIEISKILNISVGTSKSQLFKAKKLLRNQIEVII